jgi:hypothetical protein
MNWNMVVVTSSYLFNYPVLWKQVEYVHKEKNIYLVLWNHKSVCTKGNTFRSYKNIWFVCNDHLHVIENIAAVYHFPWKNQFNLTQACKHSSDCINSNNMGFFVLHQLQDLKVNNSILQDLLQAEVTHGDYWLIIPENQLTRT